MNDQDSLIESDSANGDSIGGGSCLGTSSNSDSNSNSNNNNCTGTTTTTTTDDNDFVDHFHHPSKRSQLLTAEFNQDGGCLAIGTANGFSVHNLHPQYKLSVERSLNGGIGGIEMLFRCNLIALVGGGFDPHAALHRVLIWDDKYVFVTIILQTIDLVFSLKNSQCFSYYCFYFCYSDCVCTFVHVYPVFDY
jgi:hypothetical protein